MHAGDGYAVFEAHEFGEHLGAGDDGSFAGAGVEDFGVVPGDRGAGNDNVRGRRIACGVTDVNGCAKST